MRKMKVLYHIGLISVLVSYCCKVNGQPYNESLCDVFQSSGPLSIQSGSLTFDTTYNPSGSSWELDWNETHVYQQLIKYTNSNPNQSFELRIGKGGQIYSFKNAGFGEAIPPQWRPSFDESGNNITNPGLSSPVVSNHGNWAPWNDEVWQLVGSDQRDFLDGKIKTKNIHQAGSYMNNNSHRASNHSSSPYYSPIVQQYYNPSEKSLTMISWAQSENPSYVYDEGGECSPCASEPFKPSVLTYNKYTNLGDGVIQVDFLIYNYHQTRGIDYWNIPFMGIRNSSLPYAFVSNSTTDPSSFTILNTKAGHPVVGDELNYLPEFNAGATVKTSGNTSTSSGWFAFSTQPDGNGPSLGLVTAKSTSNPANGYGDFRYGTAMSNPVRDVTILTRRAIGGAADSETGLKPWGIVAGQSIQGRYFLVVNSTIDDLVNQINLRDLTSSASVEKTQVFNQEENNIHYTFSSTASGTFTATEVMSSSSYLTLNTRPFDNSYPVFLLSTNSTSILSSNPYHFSNKPYDNTLKNIELLGFSNFYKEAEILVSGIKSLVSSVDVRVYPNPTTGFITINGMKTELDYIKIFNYLGQDVTDRVMIKRLNSTQTTIDLSTLNNGLYIINTLTTSNTVYRK